MRVGARGGASKGLSGGGRRPFAGVAPGIAAGRVDPEVGFTRRPAHLVLEAGGPPG